MWKPVDHLLNSVIVLTQWYLDDKYWYVAQPYGHARQERVHLELSLNHSQVHYIRPHWTYMCNTFSETHGLNGATLVSLGLFLYPLKKLLKNIFIFALAWILTMHHQGCIHVFSWCVFFSKASSLGIMWILITLLFTEGAKETIYLQRLPFICWCGQCLFSF